MRPRLLVPLGIVVLLGVAYAAATLLLGDRVPRSTTVAGVQIGGLAADDARERLESALHDEPIRVEVEGKSEQVEPGAAGIRLDPQATVEEAGGRTSWSPVHLWRHVAGGGEAEPVVTVDDTRLAQAVTRLEAGLGTPARNGAWRFRDGKPVEVAPVVGRRIRPDEAKAALVASYKEGLGDGPATARLELEEVQPDIDAADLQQARRTIVDPALSGRVVLAFGEARVPLPPRDYLPALRLQPRDGSLVAALDPKKVAALLDRKVAEKGEPVDATVRLVDGRPRVVPARPGIAYDAAEARAALLKVITAPLGSRRAEIAAKVDQPEVTTAEARAWKITEEVSEFTTHYPHAEYRNVNIGRAAERINGTVLAPGETFSYNGIVGERTAANGFTEGYIIDNGVLVLAEGGGVSQLATTTFNAMFFAGLEDIEHKPHSFYISRYPAGREATVAWPYLDLEFRNDTPYGVLVQAFVEPSSWSRQGTVTVRMWSTKRWEIDSRSSRRYDPTPPKTRTLTTPDCEEHEGHSGFTIDVWRDFRRPGSSEVVRTEKFHTVYKPADHIVCEEPEEPEEPAAD